MVRFLSDDLQGFKFTDRITEYLFTNLWFKTTKNCVYRGQLFLLQNYHTVLEEFGTVNSRVFLVRPWISDSINIENVTKTLNNSYQTGHFCDKRKKYYLKLHITYTEDFYIFAIKL